MDWLTEAGITHVAMESTGEYWHPVSNLLEGHFTVLLVNAAHVKNVPGRKPDKADARWLAKLLRHGLLQASFIPHAGNGMCAISLAIGRSSCRSGRGRSTACRGSENGPISSWPRWSVT